MSKHSFDEVYDSCKNSVWGLISKYSFTKEDREDIFQEIFFNVHKALPRFRGESSIKTWVYKIAVNGAINYVNKQKRHRMIVSVLSNLRILEHEPAEIGADVEMLKPLKKLNPRQRMVLLLSDVEEKKLEEISGIMKIPVGTVKSNLHRAREIVRKEAVKDEKI
ncbi:MAG: sigma-70 family RNA polymerase sigma factor [Candidatus Saganbacteria bacterium]|nr:sigma-70 family RNA polymerase sigma factor [Candidatus Saganbacteria bacterium]